MNVFERRIDEIISRKAFKISYFFFKNTFTDIGQFKPLKGIHKNLKI